MHRMNTPSLAETLATLQQWVLDADPSPDSALALLAPSPGAGAAQGLAIYRNAYRSRLREALGSVYERTRQLVGEEAFERACDVHIARRPSASPNLGDYGEGFAASLAEVVPDVPAYAEVALIDWQVARAFVAPDAEPIGAEALAALDETAWEALRMRFHPAVALVTLRWNAVAIWHALDRGLAPPAAERLAAPTGHLFWRSGMTSRFRSVDGVEEALLGRLLRGERFVAACEAVGEAFGGIEERLGEMLGVWVGDGVIAGVEGG